MGLILAFSAHAGYLPPPNSPYPTGLNNQRLLNYFTNLTVFGDVDVSIKTGSSDSFMIITGDQRDIPNLIVTEKNDTLTIGMKYGYPEYGTMHLEISTRFLNDLTVQDYSGHLEAVDLNSPYINLNLDNSGSIFLRGKMGVHHLNVSSGGIVKIQGINSQSLNINLSDNPKVYLTGMANLKHLNAHGAGHLQLYWVDSDTLTVSQHDKTYIELAGIANRLELKATDASYFDGRYLRVKNTYIKSYDTATVSLQSLKSRAAVAYDDSTIGFYGKPPFRSDLMANNGAVLDMNMH